jgi:hypothetical protein
VRIRLIANLLSAKRKVVRRVRHHRVLPYAAIPVFLVALRARPSMSADVNQKWPSQRSRGGDVRDRVLGGAHGFGTEVVQDFLAGVSLGWTASQGCMEQPA